VERITTPFFRSLWAELRRIVMVRNSGRNKSIDELRAEIAVHANGVDAICAACTMIEFPGNSQIISGSNRSRGSHPQLRSRFDAVAPMRRRKFMWMQKQPQITEEAGRKLLRLAALKVVGSLARPVILEFVQKSD